MLSATGLTHVVLSFRYQALLPLPMPLLVLASLDLPSSLGCNGDATPFYE